MSTPRTAAVVGAGLAGTTAALGLVDAGFAVTLYSDRDRDALRNDVPATGTAVYFGKSREADARIIEDLYADGPHSTGMSTRLHTGRVTPAPTSSNSTPTSGTSRRVSTCDCGPMTDSADSSIAAAASRSGPSTSRTSTRSPPTTT